MLPYTECINGDQTNVFKWSVLKTLPVRANALFILYQSKQHDQKMPVIKTGLKGNSCDVSNVSVCIDCIAHNLWCVSDYLASFPDSSAPEREH